MGLKAEYKSLTGQDLAGGGRAPKPAKEKAVKEKKPQTPKEKKGGDKDGGREVKKVTRQV